MLSTTGIEVRVGPINIYSFGGLVCMTALYLVPYSYLFISAALRRLDPSLEEASRISGSGPLRTLVTITLPAVAPAIVAAAILSIIGGIGLFSVPIIIGTPARIDLLSVYIFRMLEHYPPQTGLAILLATGMVMVVQALLVLQRLVFRQGNYAAIGGKGFRAGLVTLGRWRVVARILVVAYLFATAVLPLLGLGIVSLQRFWQPVISWSQWSFANFHFVLFANANTGWALVNSLGLGAATATAAMALVGLVMIRTHFSDGISRRMADIVTTLPATIPHTVIGLVFLLAFAGQPFRLQGTFVILFLAYLAMALPYAAQGANAAASAVGRELGEAARISGAGLGATLRDVLLPLALPALVAGWAIIFIHTAGEITATAMLASPRNPAIGRTLMDLWNYGSIPQVAALALTMTIVNAIFVAVVLRYGRRATDRAIN